jgi:hypothetical protein
VIDDPRFRAFLFEVRRALILLADGIKAMLDTPKK